MEELWSVVGFYESVKDGGALPLVEIWSHEFVNKLVE